MTPDSTTTGLTTASPSPKARGKRAELESWIRRTQPRQVGELEFEELRRELAPISESYLRKLLRESGVPLTPMVQGVRQQSFEELEASLTDLLHEYLDGDPARRMAVRRLVITAKDHARWAARRGMPVREVSMKGKPLGDAPTNVQSKPAPKDEVLLWLLTWLANPPLFPDWVRLRRAQLSGP